MDLAHWGLQRWPFQHLGAAEFHTAGAVHEEALARLMFLVDERRRCGLLVGESGTGKSCLFRQVQSYSERQGRCCLAINAAGIGADDLAWQAECQLLADCDETTTPVQSWARIRQRFSQLAMVNQPVVILLDDFDRAESDAAMAAFRLMNLADQLNSEITVLIAARRSLASRELMDLVELVVELNPWTGDETAHFVTEMLRTAGAQREIFSPSAMRSLQTVTRGNARDVVRMCDLSLLAAINDRRKQIDAALVQAVATELRPQMAGHLSS